MPYTPTVPPEFANVSEAREWFVNELRRVSEEFNETIAIELRQVGKAPTRPREGMIVSADGTNWNPGAGAGAYEYLGGVWVKL
jgi:hypothetical protein